MEGIDPRLRDAAPPQYEQQQHHHQRTPTNYGGVACQGAGYEALPQSGGNTAAGQSQQHHYYGVPTPGSFSSSQHQDAGGSPYEVQGPQNLADPNDLKRPRACEACRQLKVRCEPDDKSATGSCRRCAKASRQCVVTAPSRKRQKKTDSRVAELEKKIDALTATLHAHRRRGSGDTTLEPAVAQAQMTEVVRHQPGQLYNQPSWQDRSKENVGVGGPDSLSPVAAGRAGGGERKFKSEEQAYNEAHGSGEQQAGRPTQSDLAGYLGFFHGQPPGVKRANGDSYIDVIDRQVVDAPTAYRIFERFNTEMQFLPVVVFPPGTRAEDIRRSKPLLFLAILSAASNTIRPDLQPTFVGEVIRILADRTICRGEKTLEIVQSLQVVTVWYQPPDRYEELNFNQLIHTAVVVGMDIGMGKRSRAGQMNPRREQVGKSANPDPDAAETRRSWLGLYYMCANIAMSLRRPLLVRWSAYMDESLEVLAKAPDAAPSDKWLAHLVRSQHIAEEVGYQFSMDDPPSDVSIIEPKVQYQVKMFEKQLDELRRSSSKDMPPGILKHNEAIINLYIHEIAMHHSHNIDDFRPPYGVVEENEEEPDYVTPAHIDSLTICLDSIHRAIDAFIEMPISTIRSLPTLFFVRNCYAAVALIKMYSAVSAKGSRLGSVFKAQDLRVEYYLDAMLDRMKRAAEGGQCLVAMKFSMLISMLRSWQAKRAAGPLAGTDKAMMSFKSLSAEWEKQRPVGGQNLQDPKPASWKAIKSATSNANAGAKSQHSGLQMLSEAAMGNNSSSTTTTTTTTRTCDPAAAAAAALAAGNASQAPWDNQLASYAEMAQPQQTPPPPPPPPQQSTSNITADGFSNGYVGDMDSFTFTAEELGALGNMMDDTAWLTFGLSGGGWAM